MRRARAAAGPPRSVLVTGAAHGIGRATAELFAREGWLVTAVDVDREALTVLADDLAGTAVTTAQLDVTDPAGWERVLQEVVGRAGGTLDVLVNNAGILAAGPFADLPLARQVRVVDVNLTGVVTGCASAFPYLRRGSCVVNLASASALYGQPGLAVYSATKAAVCALTEALDLEWQPHGIRVVDVLPLFVETGMVRDNDIRSLRSLGVHLSAQDVAAAVRLAVDDRRRGRSPHRAVGRQAQVLAATSRLGPRVLQRSLVARLAR
jgi:NAD(P)-dependent dehydrogenase (short-subunit alcohol dehydrogenase family)